MAGVLYLDASALAKIILNESQSDALVREVDGWDEWLSSDLVSVEVPRAVVRAATASGASKTDIENLRREAQDLVRRLTTFELDRSSLDAAATLEPAALRTLDAIHLATILQLRDELDAVATYDARMTSALRKAGIQVIAPT